MINLSNLPNWHAIWRNSVTKTMYNNTKILQWRRQVDRCRR